QRRVGNDLSGPLNRPAIAATAVCREAVNDPDDKCGAGFGFSSPTGYQGSPRSVRNFFENRDVVFSRCGRVFLLGSRAAVPAGFPLRATNRSRSPLVSIPRRLESLGPCIFLQSQSTHPPISCPTPDHLALPDVDQSQLATV